MSSTSANRQSTSSTTIQYRNHSFKTKAEETPDKRETATATSIVTATLAQPLVTTTLPLLFLGCCTNVYALESLLQLSPETGTLTTFLQFLITALYKLPSQLTLNDSGLPSFRRRDVPLKQWALFAAQFVAINVLNNAAFSYKISLPLHIILRSGGPVMGMLVGSVWKRRHYSRRKVVGVICLFCGVVLAALSDASGKPASASTHSHSQYNLTEQAPGFLLLTAALFLSAIMGVWSDGLYDRYGRTAAIADEQLFYGHFLSLPYFALRPGSLREQYRALTAAALSNGTLQSSVFANGLHFLPPLVADKIGRRLLQVSRPMVLLLLNAVTQIACITGVHTLSTQTSALTVSIVLNVRKLVSLVLSIWIFGNVLPLGVVAGAVLVFAGVGLYSLPGSGGTTARSKDVAAKAGVKKKQ